MPGAQPTDTGFVPSKCMLCRKPLPPDGPVEQLPQNLKFAFHPQCLQCISCQKPLRASTAVLQGALVVCAECGGGAPARPPRKKKKKKRKCAFSPF